MTEDLAHLIDVADGLAAKVRVVTNYMRFNAEHAWVGNCANLIDALVAVATEDLYGLWAWPPRQQGDSELCAVCGGLPARHCPVTDVYCPHRATAPATDEYRARYNDA